MPRILPFKWTQRQAYPPPIQAAGSSKVIFLKERSFKMVISDLIQRNPVRLFAETSGQVLNAGCFGAVLARAGVGKTSFLIQIALESLLRGKNVLHISLDQPVRKVCLWYEEVFRKIAAEYTISNTNEIWEAILPHRLIMTFQAGSFQVPHLEERLLDLTEQGIFFPQLVLVDGLGFDASSREVMSEFKMVAREHGFPVWFSARAHREDNIGPDGLPSSIGFVADLFDLIVQLRFAENEIHVDLLKGELAGDVPALVLDPATFLIKQM